MYEEKSFKCPLVERAMWDAECYDVQMVRYGFIKSGVLDFTLNKYKANQTCENCQFNQLKQSAPDGKMQITA